LIGDCRQFRRAAHLRYVGMPGGERAIREPWRMAAAHLLDADCGCDLLRGRVEPAALRNAARMLERGLNSPPLVIDTRPLIRAVAEDARRGAEPGRIARRFHDTLAEIIVAVCERLRQSSGLSTVALSGGVFLNALLLQETSRRLRDAEFQVYRHRIVPPGDGGLSLGQLAVASQYP
jgi:hydrogenase maturation protein HypF